MRTILYLSCSPRGSASLSLAFAEEVLARVRERHPEASILHRDLSATPPPPVDAAFCRTILNPDFSDAPLPASEALIGELEAADAVVLATPMHNYSVPSVLKAWIDQVVRIRRTFASTPSGKVGLLRDRPVYVVVASGGWFTGPSPSGTPPQPDFLTPYLRAIFATIGITQIRFLTLEGATRDPDMLARAVNAARTALDRVLPVPVRVPGR